MASFIRSAALSPPLTGALLFALVGAPPAIREPALNTLSQYLSSTTIDRAITGLKWLFSLGLLQRCNAYLSELAGNNFRLRSQASDYNWPNEIVVVTGAASGFGALMAADFASHGLKVMALDISPSLPAHLQSNPRISYYQCDVTSPEAVNAVAEQIRSEHGNPSVLINNAGIATIGKIIDAKPKDLRKIFDVNILAHYYTVQAFLPSMIAQKKGHVVTVASMASFISGKTIVPYCNTKVAALSFHEGLSAELRSKDMYNAPEILTTCIHPIWSATPILQGNEAELRKRGQVVLPPQDISDAIVKQVISARGGQIILAGGNEWIAGIRGWPNWLSGIFLRLIG